MIVRYAVQSLLLLQAGSVSQPITGLPEWELRETGASAHENEAISARIKSTNRQASLVVRCDISGDRTLSVQYSPDLNVGISMGPVVLALRPKRTSDAVITFPIVWEPSADAAYSRDGEDDRDVSDVAEKIEGTPGTLTIKAFDRDGQPIEFTFESDTGRERIGRVVSACPWHPQKAGGTK